MLPFQQQPPANGATQSANPFGPQVSAPAQGAFQPMPKMSTAQALVGIGAANAELRYPEPPPDGKFQLKLVNPRQINGQYGLTFVYESEVLASPTHPALVGTTVSVKINGFGRPDRQKMAVQDLKALLIALFAADGLTAQTQLTDEQWAQTADASVSDHCKGRTFGAQTREWKSKTQIDQRTGLPKTKVLYNFFVA